MELYLGIVEERLRFFTPKGELVPAPKEAAIQEQQRDVAERQRALSGRGNGGGRTAAGSLRQKQEQKVCGAGCKIWVLIRTSCNSFGIAMENLQTQLVTDTWVTVSPLK